MKSNSKVSKRKDKNVEKKHEKNDNKVTSDVDSASKSQPLKYGPMPTFPHQRVWTRMVLILSVLAIIWYTAQDKKETALATRKEVLQHRGQAFECSESFQNEIENFPGCVPKKCGRYMSDKLVTNSEAEGLLRLARNGIALGGSDGGASILDLHSGALSHGRNFVNIYSLDNLNRIISAADMTVYKVVKTKIQHAIAHNFGLDVDSLYLTHPTFFSQLTNLEPKTVHDEYWHPHVDKETYQSFHYTSLLYLSDYEQDFTGGRLIWIDSPKVNITLEPRKGRVAMFSSGEENVHFVERVKSGTRYAITVSFTCDSKKAIADPVLKKKQSH
ncbi:hypothetical protein CBL_13690 [Carabus blaptoides fortunei]